MSDEPCASASGHDQAVLRLFNAKSATWSAKYAEEGRLSDRLKVLLDVVTRSTPAGGCLLDLGCGTGELALAAVEHGLQATGCDVSHCMIAQAMAADSAQCAHWVELPPSWQSLPFVSESFDVVAASSVLEYVHHPGMVLAECARVLRPGGIVLCTVPDISHPIRWAEWMAMYAAKGALIRTITGPWLRIRQYEDYLLVSRQRHRLGWWTGVAAQAGLVEADPQTTGRRSPLRLLAFQRPVCR